ncbi:MAG: acyl carrier protein [Trichodesmium sp.]|uniref:acyl carrier protein n=1 Tax=Dapis sp. BLCC M126 TaxID=3400189 RepID=UPI003CEAE001
MENLTFEDPNQPVVNGLKSKNLISEEELQDWLVSYLSQMLDIDIEEVSTTTSFARYGLNSSASISLIHNLSDWIGQEIDPTIMYSYPTIEAIAKHLAG